MSTCAVLLLLLAADAARVQRLIELGRVDEAFREVQALLEARPADPALLNLEGIIRAQRGELTAAITSFQKALTGAPGSASIYANLARVYQQAGKTDLAFRTWRQVTSLDPSNREANYQLAYLALHQNDPKGALAYLDKLDAEAQATAQALAVRLAAAPDAATLERLKNHPKLREADITGVLAVLISTRQEGLVMDLLETLRRRSLAGRESLEALAGLYERRAQWDAARTRLEEAAHAAGKADIRLLLGLARVSYRQGDYKGTLGYLGQARQADPENAAVHFFFGMTAVALNLPLEAKASLARAVELAPSNPFHNYAYGAVLAGERDASPSIPFFERYVQLRPQDVRGHFALAIAYFLANQFSEARRRLEVLVAHKETASGAHYFLGKMARQQNRLEDAERELKAALATLAARADAPAELADARAELGLVYMRQRRFDLAEEQLSLALRLDPNHYQANQHLLALYQRKKDPRAADQSLRLEGIKKLRSEQEQALWRTVEIRPY